MKTAKENNALFEVSLKFIIKDETDKILLLKMPKTGPMGGYYDLPGGRIKEHEKSKPFSEIISRELTEELGTKSRITFNQIPVAAGRHTYPRPSSSDEGHIFWIFFEGLYQGGDIEMSPEHDGYDWISLEKHNLDKYFVRGPWEGMYNYFYKTFPHKLIKD